MSDKSDLSEVEKSDRSKLKETNSKKKKKPSSLKGKSVMGSFYLRQTMVKINRFGKYMLLVIFAMK